MEDITNIKGLSMGRNDMIRINWMIGEEKEYVTITHISKINLKDNFDRCEFELNGYKINEDSYNML